MGRWRCCRATKVVGGRRRWVAGSVRLKAVGRSDLLAVSALRGRAIASTLGGVDTDGTQCRGRYHGPSPTPFGTFVPAAPR
jgi:hypothetical protein